MTSIQMAVQYFDYHWNTGPVFKWHSNTRPFSEQTTSDNSNAGCRLAASINILPLHTQSAIQVPCMSIHMTSVHAAVNQIGSKYIKLSENLVNWLN